MVLKLIVRYVSMEEEVLEDQGAVAALAEALVSAELCFPVSSASENISTHGS